jgi:hypothetical protein
MEENNEQNLVDTLMKFIEQVNVINKRLVIAIVAVAACVCIMCAVVGGMAVHSYFYSDYPYSTLTQSQSENGSAQAQTATNGGVVSNG